MALTTPVVFLIFNRPAITRRVFNEIAKARPKKLLVVCDGPRLDRKGEPQLVDACRAVIEHVDWDCDVQTNYSDINLGCKQRVASGLEWVFNAVEEAIVLEDDCLPDPTFFSFCETMLHRYRNDTRISNISASNFQGGRNQSPYNYYFSKYFHCWGWASWRRTWQTFDLDLKTWPDFQAAAGLAAVADSAEEEAYWRRIFDCQARGETSSWAFGWLYSSFAQNGLTVLPDRNLTTNIGFGSDATHTSGGVSPLANMPTGPVHIRTHPQTIVRNKRADEFTFQNVYRMPRGLEKIRMSIKKRIDRLFNKAA